MKERKSDPNSDTLLWPSGRMRSEVTSRYSKEDGHDDLSQEKREQWRSLKYDSEFIRMKENTRHRNITNGKWGQIRKPRKDILGFLIKTEKES